MVERRDVERGVEPRRFWWPAPGRQTHRPVGALLTAGLLTAATAASISGGLASLYRLGDGAPLVQPQLAADAVVFVTTTAPPTIPRREQNHVPPPTVDRAAPTAAGSSRVMSVETGAVNVPRPSATPDSGATATSATGTSATGTATTGAPSGIAVSPVLLPASRFGTSTLSRAERDSLLHEVSLAVPALAFTRTPTRAEVDSSYRAEALRQWWWRQQGRPIPIEGMVGSISFPLFSSGPSAAQRARDRKVHADNLLRLERLAERARARRDSSPVAASAGGASRTSRP